MFYCVNTVKLKKIFLCIKKLLVNIFCKGISSISAWPNAIFSFSICRNFFFESEFSYFISVLVKFQKTFCQVFMLSLVRVFFFPLITCLLSFYYYYYSLQKISELFFFSLFHNKYLRLKKNEYRKSYLHF